MLFKLLTIEIACGDQATIKPHTSHLTPHTYQQILSSQV
ncbi:hypothetical protein MICAI_1870009 [Microcystis sp. T1-4]|nr:hypothetical protein MICAI_1870009 [Microcystis sp. T1-4]